MINIHPASFRDIDAHVFLHDGAVYRQMRSNAADFMYGLIDQGVVEELIQSNLLIDTKQVMLPERTEGFDERGLVHERIPVQTYPWEWSFEMRRQAAETTVNLLEQAHRLGLNLKDGTPLNVTYMKGRMVWFDVLSLTPLENKDMWNGYRQFCQGQLFPLLIESHTDITPNPWLRSDFEGIPAHDAAKILGWSRCFKQGVFKHVLLQSVFERRNAGKVPDNKIDGEKQSSYGLSTNALIAVARSYGKLIAKLPQPCRRSAWHFYATDNTYTHDDEIKKKQVIDDFLGQLNAHQILDLGCNTGTYTNIATDHANHVIAIDSDSDSIDSILTSTPPNKLKKITPIVADIMMPSIGHGWRGGESLPLEQRIKSDAFLALALVHHLCISRNLSIRMFVDFLADLAPKGIVEWVGKDDPMVQSLMQNRKDIFLDYTQCAFEKELANRFAKVEKISLKVRSRSLYIVQR